MYWLLSTEVRAVRDLAPGQIDLNVIGSGSSNLSAVFGLTYFQRSHGTDPFMVENHVWKCSGPSRTTSLAVEVIAEAIGNSGVAATAAQRSRKGVC